jgi:hypothetical protein
MDHNRKKHPREPRDPEERERFLTRRAKRRRREFVVVKGWVQLILAVAFSCTTMWLMFTSGDTVTTAGSALGAVLLSLLSD